MYLCYVDESGTPDIPGNTSHFVLTGISIPVWHWKTCDREIHAVKAKYGLQDAEIHTAWMLRKYREQRLVPDFASLDEQQRRYEVGRARTVELLRLQRVGNSSGYRQTKKNYRKTESYVHLSYDERKTVIAELARCVSSWGFARLFAECIDKVHFDPARTTRTVGEQAFEQVVSRFEQFLQISSKRDGVSNLGLLIHDNNRVAAQ
jgi:hypothetical protein